MQAWFTNDKTISGASILDTTLGGEPAKKAVFPALPKKILTGAVYDGMHVYAELLPGLSEAYWNEVYNTILADFRFTEGHTGSGIRQNQAAGSAASYDEEEVLE